MADLLSRVKEHAPAASWLTQESATTACLALSTQYEVRHLLVGALFSSRVASSLTTNFAELAVAIRAFSSWRNPKQRLQV